MKKLFSIFLGAIFIIMGCQVMDKIAYTPISEILNNPREYENKIVSIKGEVFGIENYMLVKSFKVTDESGSITVSTERSLPNVGETIAIEGVVKVVDVPIAGKVIVIKELADVKN